MKDMKRNAILTIILAALLVGCDYLDYSEQSFYDDSEDIFDNFGRTRQFLADIYGTLPTDYSSLGGAMRSAACDEAEYTIQSSSIQNFTNGQWSAANALDNNWSKYFTGIRSANLFLDEIAGRTFNDYKYNENYDEEMEKYNLYQYEARFLRAFFYFELAKRYGDIPMPSGVINDVDAINSIEKTSFDTIIAYIADECDAVVDSLPVAWDDITDGVVDQETGRVTRGAVMALKTRALLYAASPLHNPSGDKTKWEAAAAAANDFLLNVDFTYSFDNEYYNSNDMTQGAFNNRASSGLIFERRQGNANSFEKSNFPKGFDGATGNSTCPSQNLIDAYQTTDGFDVVLGADGQWTAPGSTVFDPANPYDNRDPRLLQSVIVNGKAWKGTTVETYVGGAHGAPMADVSLTGYYLKKYVRQDLEIAGSNAATKEHTWVIFRLAEMYLCFAEAMNEAYGPTAAPQGYAMDAITALNFVRMRAAVNMPFVMTNDEAELRALIIRERQVELAFEDHRFWDIRRWKLIDDTNPNKITEDIYGVKITNNAGAYSYAVEKVDDRFWDNKMYLYPFPYNETKINPNLGQNPGW